MLIWPSKIASSFLIFLSTLAVMISSSCLHLLLYRTSTPLSCPPCPPWSVSAGVLLHRQR
jgi:hypothetical protein